MCTRNYAKYKLTTEVMHEPRTSHDITYTGGYSLPFAPIENSTAEPSAQISARNTITPNIHEISFVVV